MKRTDGKPVPTGRVSLRQLFRYADGWDKFLMFWGTLGGMVYSFTSHELIRYPLLLYIGVCLSVCL
jgi:heme O synthase-like polyprenyltransferase